MYFKLFFIRKDLDFLIRIFEEQKNTERIEYDLTTKVFQKGKYNYFPTRKAAKVKWI